MKKNESGCGSLIAFAIVITIIGKVLDFLYFFRYVFWVILILIAIIAVIVIIINMLPSKDDIDTGREPYTDDTETNAETDNNTNTAVDIDNMEGRQFEYFCADVLKRNGYKNVYVTKGSGDQGVDILAERDGIKYAIQCKRYSNVIGNSAVQEVHAGAKFYGCHIGIVVSNNSFTKSAHELADKTGVVLWDRKELLKLMKNNF